MRPVLKRIPAVVAALLLLTPLASAQTATADVPPGVTLRLEVMGPARVHYSGKSVTIDFSPDPIPPPPIPPGPQPPPDPKPTPDPPKPPPQPTWGPLDRILILYETSKATGREAIYSQAFQDALTEVAPKDAGGWPRWRVWDKDMTAPDATAAVESAEWSAVLAKARPEHGDKPEPVMYARDAKGGVAVVPLKDLTLEAAVAKVRDLATWDGKPR